MMLLITKNLKERSNLVTTAVWMMNLYTLSKPGAGSWFCVPVAVLRLWEVVKTPIVELLVFPA